MSIKTNVETFKEKYDDTVWVLLGEEEIVPFYEQFKEDANSLLDTLRELRKQEDSVEYTEWEKSIKVTLDRYKMESVRSYIRRKAE